MWIMYGYLIYLKYDDKYRQLIAIYLSKYQRKTKAQNFRSNTILTTIEIKKLTKRTLLQRFMIDPSIQLESLQKLNKT